MGCYFIDGNLSRTFALLNVSFVKLKVEFGIGKS